MKIPVIIAIAFLFTQAARGTTLSGPPIIYDGVTVCWRVKTNSAQVTTVIDSNGTETSSWVEWGTTSDYGDTGLLVSLPDYYSPYDGVGKGFDLKGLLPHTTYHFRIVAQNAFGKSMGANHIFVTLLHDEAPALTTLDADSITSHSAILHAICNPEGSMTVLYFQWGDSLISSAEEFLPILPDDTVDTVVSHKVEPLLPNTTYYYYPVAWYYYSNDFLTFGGTKTFETLMDTSEKALVIPITVKDCSGHGPTIHFGVHTYATSCIDHGFGEDELPPLAPEGSMESRFLGRCMGMGSYLDLRNYSSSTQIDTYWVHFAGRADKYPVTVSWPDLDSMYTGSVTLSTADDTVDMKNTTSCQISNCDIENFRIVAVGPSPKAHSPNVITETATDVGESSAKLTAVVYPNCFSTSAWFELGATTAYGSTTTMQNIGNSGGKVTVGADVAALQPNTIYHYRAVAKNGKVVGYGEDQTLKTNGATGVGEGEQKPKEYSLYQNHPNPFNPSTIIRFELPDESHATLKVYDLLGRELLTVLDDSRTAGTYDVEVDGSRLSSGIYFYRLEATSIANPGKIFMQVRKMLLIK